MNKEQIIEAFQILIDYFKENKLCEEMEMQLSKIKYLKNKLKLLDKIEINYDIKKIKNPILMTAEWTLEKHYGQDFKCGFNSIIQNKRDYFYQMIKDKKFIKKYYKSKIHL